MQKEGDNVQVMTFLSPDNRTFFCLNALLVTTLSIAHRQILRRLWRYGMEKVGKKRVFCRIFYFTLLMVFSTVYAGLAGAGTINFEEPIFHPDMLTTQYCDQGVEFLVPARIFEPSVETSSGIHALTNNFGGEFGEANVIKIRFATPQSAVSVNVGLDQQYTTGVYAFLLAFDTENPGTTFLDPGFVGFAQVVIGVEPTPINRLLSLTSDQKNIHSISVIFKSTISNTGDIPRFELIDDLTFSDVGPSCASNNSPMLFLFDQPETSETITNPLTDLEFVVLDNDGIAQIKVSFQNAAELDLDSFYACGELVSNPCMNYEHATGDNAVQFAQKVHIPDETSGIQIIAWDFAGNPGYKSRFFDLIPPGKNMNLWAKAMEITQAVQPWLEENLDRRLQGGTPPKFLYPHYAHVPPRTVPLVAGRTTVVRLYGGVENTTSDMPLENVKAVLRCFQDPLYLNPCPSSWEILPEDRPPFVKHEITLTPGNDIDTMRRDVRFTWNFVLPEAWTQPDRIYLEGEVIPPQGLQECPDCGDAANRIRVSEVVFNSMPFPANGLIHVFRIRRNLDGQITIPSQSEIDNVLDGLGKVLPIDEGTLPGYTTTITFFDDASKTSDIRSTQVLKSLPLPFFHNILGLIDDGFGGHDGRGRVGGGVCYAKARNLGLTSAPHELGHAIGLLHAGPNGEGHGDECIDDDFCEDSWPYPHGTTGAFGFDVFDMEAIPPGVTELDPHDIMSYGCCKWVSPRTWIRFFNNFTWSNNWPVPKASITLESNEYDDTEKVSTNETPGQFLVVRGQQEEISGIWDLLPMYEMVLPQEPQVDSELGEYSIELADAKGQILSVHRFLISKNHFDTQDIDDVIPEPLNFVRYIPSVEGAVSLIFKKNDETLATLNQSAARPTLQILSPTENGMECSGNDCQIRWTADDNDGDQLYFLVQYSNASEGLDQVSWNTLAGDLDIELLDTALTDLSGGNESRVRVFATDGFNSTVAVSDPFFVADKPPRARILESDGNVVINEGNRRMLRGTGYDMEDGLLGSDRLSWHSNLDGPVGAGAWLTPNQLTPGIHQIIFKAIDSQGQYGEDSIEIEILKKLNIQPTADAGPDISVLPGGTVLLDGSGSLDPDGDILEFHWQITDQPAGSNPVLTNPDAIETEMVTDLEGEYTIELTVHDAQVSSLPDQTIVSFVNRPPISVCRDIIVDADGTCKGYGSIDGGSFDPDQDDAFTVSINPQAPYDIGSVGVLLTIIDMGGLSDQCTGTVTVQDATSPIISCNTPATITPPDAPISFTATATDNCDVSLVEITQYDCYTFTKKGKRIDKTESCVVDVAGDTITILDSGGVDDHITWEISATDSSGNTTTKDCGILVVNPGQT